MATEPRILVYLLRRDLRLGDNPIFHRAVQAFQADNRSFTHFLPLYIFSSKQIEVSGFLKPAGAGNAAPSSPYPEARSAVGKFWRCGPHRAKFLAESVFDVKRSLQTAKSDLCIRLGPPADVIRDAFQFYEASQTKGKIVGVWMVGEDTDEEIVEQNDVKRVVQSKGADFQLFKDEKYFIDDDDLPFSKIADLSDVFTEFKKKVEPLRERPHPVLPRPSQLPPFPEQNLVPPVHEAFQVPDSKDDIISCLLKPLDKHNGLKTPPVRPADNVETYSAHPFAGGETAAMERLNHLIKSGAMSAYKDTRNGMVGTEFSTKLSAYLAIGALTARQIHASMAIFENGESAVKTEEDRRMLAAYRGVKDFGKGENKGTAAVRFELLWRDYMRLCARKFGSRLFFLEGFRKDEGRSWKRPQGDSGTAAEYNEEVNRVLSGHSGIGLVDASQRELYWTGYTSNRARQNVASFLSKHLKIDWRLGAEWYESMLVDYDVASNWGNWQYVAGVGNDPREGRVFNPVKQALDYDAKGEYIINWIPELRRLNIKNARGEVDQNRLMGLFQAWMIPQDTAQQLGLGGLEWVRKPLIKIHFDPRRPPKGANRGPKSGRGRGGSSGGQGGRGNYRGRGGRGGQGSYEGNAEGRGGFSHRGGRDAAQGDGGWRPHEGRGNSYTG